MAGTPLGFIDDGAVGYAAGYGQLVDMVLEYVPDLIWPLSIRTYARMRWDPVLKSTLAAYTLPIRRASWAIDPAGCRPAVIDHVADQLGLPVLGADPEPGPARRRGVNWGDHLRVSLLDLTFGHMPFERTYNVDGPLATIDVLQERMPQTIAQIDVNSDGSLASITQNVGATNAPPEIPAQNLVWYSHDKEGSAWMGQSLLRPAYAAWLIKDEMRRVLATSSRRFGMGVWTVTAPAGATPSQVAQASALASAYRAGDQSGVGLPDGFIAKLEGLTGSAPDTLSFIRYLDSQMSRSTLTGMLDLGDSSNGSRALGDTFVDLFLLALQSIADDHANTATSQLVVPLVDVNWGEDEPAPRVVCGDVGSQHQVTAAAINELVRFGALQPDPSLDAWLRGEWKLPARTTPWVKPVDPVTPTGPVPSASRPQPRAAGGGDTPFRRDLTPHEVAAKTDFQTIQQDWETALEQLVNDWAGITAAQRASLVAQIRSAVESDDTAALGDLQVDSSAGAALLADRMHTLAGTAAAQQAAEAAAQGISVATGVPDGDRISGTATSVASLAGQSLVSSAGASALQAWGPASSAETVAAAVDEHLSSLAGSDLTYLLGGALSSGQNIGRFATLSLAPEPEATYVSSEILDKNTCEACEAEDGHEFDSLADAQEAYASGGFVGCQGGLRCRGIISTVWHDVPEQQAA